MRVSAKLQALKAGHALRAGGLLAHHTSTLPGIAASPFSKQGTLKAQGFKQRQGPFLLLADSRSTALKQAVFITPALRKLAKTSWPGSVTLVFKAKKHLGKLAYQKGMIAIRVDANQQTRVLAEQCGGLMFSSSLNRKGQAVQQPSTPFRYRFKRHFAHHLAAACHQVDGEPSKIYKIVGQKVMQLR